MLLDAHRALEELPPPSIQAQVPQSLPQLHRDVHLLHGGVLLNKQPPRIQVCLCVCVLLTFMLNQTGAH
jgi:hypothetical protein